MNTFITKVIALCLLGVVGIGLLVTFLNNIKFEDEQAQIFTIRTITITTTSQTGTASVSTTTL